jgi:hypothetical protein
MIAPSFDRELMGFPSAELPDRYSDNARRAKLFFSSTKLPESIARKAGEYSASLYPRKIDSGIESPPTRAFWPGAEPRRVLGDEGKG